jgi:hypothetical protein
VIGYLDADFDAVAEEVRSRISKQIFRLADGKAARCTCSVGFCAYPFVRSASSATHTGAGSRLHQRRGLVEAVSCHPQRPGARALRDADHASEVSPHDVAGVFTRC